MRAAKQRRQFTLMEVMIAATVLAIAVAMSLGIVGGARGRILRAEQRWGRQHLLAQVAELYLLAGPYAELPEGLLPEGFSSSCELRAVEDLPEEALEPIQGWVLGEFRIEVYDVNGAPMGSVTVQKVVKEEDCE
jgi:type II secretory pathway pseudopilin PulG